MKNPQFEFDQAANWRWRCCTKSEIQSRIEWCKDQTVLLQQYWVIFSIFWFWATKSNF
jgi:hypothetical protein